MRCRICQGFRGTFGAKVTSCKPADPSSEGHHRTQSRLSGDLVCARPFVQRAGRFQLATVGVVGRRKRALGYAPADRIEADRAQVPLVTGWQYSTRLARGRFRPTRFKRPLRVSVGDRTVHRGHRRSGPSASVVRGSMRRRSCSNLGETSDTSDFDHVKAVVALRHNRITVVHPAAEPEVQIRDKSKRPRSPLSAGMLGSR